MRRQYGVPKRNLVGAVFCAPLACVLTACTSLSAADLRHAADAEPTPFSEAAPAVWRARLPIRWRGKLSALCRLCEQYDLVEVRDPPQWRAFCKAAGIDPAGLNLNFKHGRVIGVVAYLGEPLEGRWPLDLQAVGYRERSAWIEARLRGDLFHPVSAPGFCVFTYVSRPYPVSLVKVAHRVFLVWE